MDWQIFFVAFDFKINLVTFPKIRNSNNKKNIYIEVINKRLVYINTVGVPNCVARYRYVGKLQKISFIYFIS